MVIAESKSWRGHRIRESWPNRNSMRWRGLDSRGWIEILMRWHRIRWSWPNRNLDESIGLYGLGRMKILLRWVVMAKSKSQWNGIGVDNHAESKSRRRCRIRWSWSNENPNESIGLDNHGWIEIHVRWMVVAESESRKGRRIRQS